MRRNPILPRDQRGIALIMVIWVLALLSLMAASFLAQARSELRRAANLRDRATAEALAEGGIHLALGRLLAEHGATYPQRWTEALGGGSVSITLTDERGKIDLNEADPTLLASLFESAGVPARAATDLAAAVADFRDPDHGATAGGAEDADYPPGSGGAKDARFESIDELLQVKGVTPALHAQLADLVTVHSSLGNIDPLIAAEGVLRAVPNIDRAELTKFLAVRKKVAPLLEARKETSEGAANQRRAKAFAQLQAALPQRNSVDRYFTLEGAAAPTFTISAEGRSADGARYRRDAVVRLAEEGAGAFHLLEWRRPHFTEADGY
jgi:general secretion pathway protein K